MPEVRNKTMRSKNLTQNLRTSIWVRMPKLCRSRKKTTKLSSTSCLRDQREGWRSCASQILIWKKSGSKWCNLTQQSSPPLEKLQDHKNFMVIGVINSSNKLRCHSSRWTRGRASGAYRMFVSQKAMFAELKMELTPTRITYKMTQLLKYCIVWR